MAQLFKARLTTKKKTERGLEGGGDPVGRLRGT